MKKSILILFVTMLIMSCGNKGEEIYCGTDYDCFIFYADDIIDAAELDANDGIYNGEPYYCGKYLETYSFCFTDVKVGIRQLTDPQLKKRIEERIRYRVSLIDDRYYSNIVTDLGLSSLMMGMGI